MAHQPQLHKWVGGGGGGLNNAWTGQFADMQDRGDGDRDVFVTLASIPGPRHRHSVSAQDAKPALAAIAKINTAWSPAFRRQLLNG